MLCCEPFKSVSASLEHWRGCENGRQDQGDRACYPAGRQKPGPIHDTVLEDAPHCPLSHRTGGEEPLLSDVFHQILPVDSYLSGLKYLVGMRSAAFHEMQFSNPFLLSGSS